MSASRSIFPLSAYRRRVRGEHGLRDGPRLKEHVRVHREVLAVSAAAGAIGVEIAVAVHNRDADAVALPAFDPHGLVHVHAVEVLDDPVGALQHPHEDGFVVVDDAGLPKTCLVVEVQAPLVLGLCGEVEPVRAVGLEIADNFLQSGLTAALVLLRFVDHEAPEPVAIIRIFPFRIKGKHTKAHEPIVRIDGEGPGHAGGLRFGFRKLTQRHVVGGHEGLVLPHS